MPEPSFKDTLAREPTAIYRSPDVQAVDYDGAELPTHKVSCGSQLACIKGPLVVGMPPPGGGAVPGLPVAEAAGGTGAAGVARLEACPACRWHAVLTSAAASYSPWMQSSDKEATGALV